MNSTAAQLGQPSSHLRSALTVSHTNSTNFRALGLQRKYPRELCSFLPGFQILPFMTVGSCPIPAGKFKPPITISFRWLISSKLTALLP